jgi:hypothetical protein
MLHLRVTQPFAQRHRILTVAKRNSANTAQLDWTLELQAGDTPALELFRAMRPAVGAVDFLRNALQVGWDGKVGIGIANPQEKLHVGGNVRFACPDRCISGATINSVTSGVVGATIAGGGSGSFPVRIEPNSVTDDFGAVGGGRGNRAGDNAGTTSDKVAATVSGGAGNTASGGASTVGGGEFNAASGSASTIGGGGNNEASGNASTVGGGVVNRASGDWSAVSGGAGNTASGEKATVGGGTNHTASGLLSTVGGGENNGAVTYGATVSGGIRNQAGDPANPNQSGNATVGGGTDNTASGMESTVSGGSGNVAVGQRSTVGGGRNNGAIGFYSTVPGGENNEALASHSFAAGHHALARHFGAFVWADSTGFPFESTQNNQFNVRAGGGTRILSDAGATVGVELLPGANAWSAISDRNLKANFLAVDGREILQRLSQIPILEWNLKSQEARIRHVGPMAQDFYAAFGLGESDRHISSSDADGVALISIQVLYELNREKEQQIAQIMEKLTEKDQTIQDLHTSNAALQAQIGALHQQNARLDARLTSLEQAASGMNINSQNR